MIYNCHIHTFMDKDVPRNFLPFGLVGVLSSKPGFNMVKPILNFLGARDNKYYRYLNFVKAGRMKSQQKIFEECQQFYPKNSKFVVLPMDMAYMGAGRVPRPYEEQLKELADLKNNTFPDFILPFIHIDPRRDKERTWNNKKVPEYMYLLMKCVEEWGFKGIKLYPPLGVFPYDDRLDPVYEYAVKKKLPIIAHGSPYNPVHFKGSDNDLKELLSKAKTNIDLGSNKKLKLCANFTHPENYKLVFEKFPDLKICLAHFGSAHYWNKLLDRPNDQGNWLNIIREMMLIYPGLYTDISYTMYNKEFYSLLTVLLSDPDIAGRILFGSDYYMDYVEAKERRFSIDLRAAIGEANWKSVTYDNPIKFLS